jgi:hypothetical protein
MTEGFALKRSILIGGDDERLSEPLTHQSVLAGM